MNTTKKIAVLRRLLDQSTKITVRNSDDPKFKTWKNTVERTLNRVFGPDSPELKQFQKLRFFYSAPIMVLDSDYSSEHRECFERDFEILISSIKNYIEELQQDHDEEVEEKLEDTGEDIEEKVSTSDFWQDIHPKITSVAKRRFETAHYADAVLSAFREVNSCVKKIVMNKTANELDGASLMHTAFSPTNPIIVLDDLSKDSGKNIQKGYMEIFAGAMIGIRNPKAHENTDIEEIPAKHRIYLASLLMNKIDERI